jgi:tetratricopeptide (TPR) repeat protein
MQDSFDQGKASLEKGDYDTAIAYFSAAVQRIGSAEAYECRGVAYKEKGDLGQAIKDLREAIRLKPDLAEAHAALASVYGLQGRYPEAMAASKEAIRLKPQLAVAWTVLGAAYKNLGRFDEAIDAQKKAVSLNPDFPEAHANLAAVYAVIGRFHEAIDADSEAIRLRPRFANAYCNRGNTYLQMGELDRAIKDFDEAIRLKPRWADALYARGTARAKKGDVEAAKADFGKAAELEPGRYGLATTPQSEMKDVPSDPLLRRATAALGTSDRSIIPGVRVGPLRLAGKIDELVKLFGSGTRLNPERRGDPALETWDAIGLWVQFDEATGNIMSISVDSIPKLWAQHRTREGISLGTKEEEVVALFGAPERTVVGGPSKSLYYDRIGIRLTVAYIGPFAGKVGSLRVVWPSVPPGDTLIVAGKRISGIDVGMPIDKVLSALGGGYHKGESRPGVHIYYWPHLGLSVVERSGRVTSVRAARHGPSDAANIRYATSEGLGLGSRETEIKKVYGEDAEKGPGGGWLFWTYRSQGISFAFDENSRVTLVDVFPAEK